MSRRIPTLDKFDSRLVLALHQSDMSSGELAATLGCDPPQVSRWVRHGVQPRPATIQRIADALDVDRAWLAFGPTETTP